ncbi:MAG: hypothetical protein WB424_14905 [Terracidiphilus sp.]
MSHFLEFLLLGPAAIVVSMIVSELRESMDDYHRAIADDYLSEPTFKHTETVTKISGNAHQRRLARRALQRASKLGNA